MLSRLWVFFTEDKDGKETVLEERICKCPDLTDTYKGMQRNGFTDGIVRYGYKVKEGTGAAFGGFVNEIPEDKRLEVSDKIILDDNPTVPMVVVDKRKIEGAGTTIIEYCPVNTPVANNSMFHYGIFLKYKKI